MESLGEKALGAMMTTNNIVNPQMASTPGFEPGPHWRGVLSIVRQHCFPYPSPPLLPHIGIKEIILACQSMGIILFIPSPTPPP